MAVCAHIVGDSDTTLWHLTGRQRLQRALTGQRGIACSDDLTAAANTEAVILIRGDHVYDSRVLDALVRAQEDMAVSASDGDGVVAARVGSDRAQSIAATLERGSGETELRVYKPADLAEGARTGLKGVLIPRVDPIRVQDQGALENRLFSGAYKGVTDLVTKWLWPRPARWATRGCLRLGVNPNAVTLTSLVLAVLAAIAFLEGAYVTGLLAAWLMTFLDTLDGKLARVSIESSRFGDRLDHGLDLVHPPFWYLAWGLGLGGAWQLTPDFAATVALIFATYIGGRLCEGAFQLIAPFSLFVWRPFDSVNRLVTARRNPNLLLLTGSLIAGRPDVGLWLVAAWHLLSTLILIIRLVWAAWQRWRHGGLDSWLDAVDPVSDRGQWVVRLFTQAPPRS